MREEPVIYISGRPFLLYEAERPCKKNAEPRRMLKYAASLSTSLPNGRVRTEIKSDEKPIIVIDNYDSFTYNLCQDEAKSMQQSQHEDVVMEARVRARHGSVLAIHTQDVFFPGQKESTSMHFHGTPHVFKIFCGAGGTLI